MKKNNHSITIDFPLDDETVDSILTIRRLRLHNLRRLISTPERVQELLRERGLLNPNDIVQEDELKLELQMQLDQLEKYDSSPNVHLEELQEYLEIICHKPDGALRQL